MRYTECMMLLLLLLWPLSFVDTGRFSCMNKICCTDEKRRPTLGYRLRVCVVPHSPSRGSFPRRIGSHTQHIQHDHGTWVMAPLPAICHHIDVRGRGLHEAPAHTKGKAAGGGVWENIPHLSYNIHTLYRPRARSHVDADVDDDNTITLTDRDDGYVRAMIPDRPSSSSSLCSVPSLCIGSHIINVLFLLFLLFGSV